MNNDLACLNASVVVVNSKVAGFDPVRIKCNAV
jgi:hypothetical protein